MTTTCRITVALPANLLQAVEQKRINAEERRSAVVRRLLGNALLSGEDESQAQRFVEEYRKKPQTEAEFGWFA